MRALPQALEIIFEVKMKMSNENIARRKISFATHKPPFVPFFSSLWAPPTFKAFNFLICYSFQ
jgi:hypothetical protein